jgi:hypothetical protein
VSVTVILRLARRPLTFTRLTDMLNGAAPGPDPEGGDEAGGSDEIAAEVRSKIARTPGYLPAVKVHTALLPQGGPDQ